jgi:hypothetical protein
MSPLHVDTFTALFTLYNALVSLHPFIPDLGCLRLLSPHFYGRAVRLRLAQPCLVFIVNIALQIQRRTTQHIDYHRSAKRRSITRRCDEVQAR